MVEVLQRLHVLIKVDVHGEGRVCVVRRVEVGDGSGGQTQAAQHCVDSREGVQGPESGKDGAKLAQGEKATGVARLGWG